MKQEYQFRHELKYRISYAQYIELRNRLRTVMQSDIHTARILENVTMNFRHT